MASRLRLLSILLLGPLLFIGCSGYSALEPGSAAPVLEAVGWLENIEPNIENKVVVLEAFATW